MTDHVDEIARLRTVCPGAALWDEAGEPLVFLPDLKVDSAGTVHTVDALLCPRMRDGYDTRLYYSRQLPVPRDWSAHAVMAGSWYTFSWQGIPASQPWLDILASHLDAAT